MSIPTDYSPEAEADKNAEPETQTEKQELTAVEEHNPPLGDAIDYSKSVLRVGFYDFSCDPLSNLRYKLECADKKVTGKTDVNGAAQEFNDILSGSVVDVFVWREYTKDYKQIGQVVATPGECDYGCYSPKLKFQPVETEAHEGAKGKAEEDLPPKSESAAASKGNSTVEKRGQTAASAPASAPAVVKPVKSEEKKVIPGRDKNGNPVAKIEDDNKDWLKRKVLAILNFWTWADFQKKNTAPASQKTQASSKPGKGKTAPVHPSVSPGPVGQKNPALKPVPMAPAQQDNIGVDLAKLQKLIDFAEKQVKLDYKAKYRSQVSANVRADYTKTDEPTFPEKNPDKSRGACLAYVKLALWKSGYANSISGTECAKNSGPDWVNFGFADVSASLPKVEIDYGVVQTEEERKFNANIENKRNSIESKEKDVGRLGKLQALKDGADKKVSRQVKHVQPDVMYTLPGDVIVYEQVNPEEKGAAGHIDIRTYHGFMSDFNSHGNVPNLGGVVRKSKHYRITGVYRKNSDLLAAARVQAFLRILRELEAKGYQDPYHALHYDGKNHRTFEDFSQHPSGKEENNPAGAYQIRRDSWRVAIKAMGWPEVFDKTAQDRAAIFKLFGRPFPSKPPIHPRRNALGYIMEGKVQEAVEETGLHNEWACLPGGGRQAQISMPELKERFNKYVKECMK